MQVTIWIISQLQVSTTGADKFQIKSNTIHFEAPVLINGSVRLSQSAATNITIASYSEDTTLSISGNATVRVTSDV